jgi:hypothetical protein
MNATAASARRQAGDAPPQSIDDAPLSIEAASALMARFGFVTFSTPPGSAIPDSCLMAILRDTPTLVHFDPESVSYWTFEDGHGQARSIDLATPVPISRPFSWGRIEIRDRHRARNCFVSFGGDLTAERVGPNTVLVIFRSPAPILRLFGHSQRPDELARDVATFFARTRPRLWDSIELEQRVGRLEPEALWAAFVVHEHGRLDRSTGDAAQSTMPRVRRALRDLVRERPGALVAGGALLRDLGLSSPAAAVPV